MPLMRCEHNGWKYGESGKCYHGPNAKKKAIKQAVAIQMSQKRRGKKPEKISSGRLRKKAMKRRIGR